VIGLTTILTDVSSAMSFFNLAKRSTASPLFSRRSIVTVSDLSPRVKLAVRFAFLPSPYRSYLRSRSC
jgi:hypothetical protein